MRLLEDYDQFAGRKKMIENEKKKISSGSKQLKQKQKELKHRNIKLQFDKATQKKKELQAKLQNDVGGANYYN